MKRLLTALALVLAFATASLGQTTTRTLSTTTCPGAGCVTLSVSGQGSVSVQVTGTFTGTLTFEATTDGVNYAALSMTPSAGGDAATTTTTTGLWQGSVGGLGILRVRFSAYTNGSAVISMQTAPAGAGLRGGGGSAPDDATYILKTADGDLPNAQALGALSSGILRAATTTGVVTSLGDQLPLANGGTAANLVDPNADRVLFWDDSAGATTWLTMGTNLSITDTTLNAAGGIAGSDTQVLFFDGANNPAGDAGLTYNKTTDALTAGLVVSTGADIAATLTTALAGANNDLTYTAVNDGQAGNAVTMTYADDVSLSVSVVGTAITVNIETGVSTANDVLDAIEAEMDAADLVTVALAPGSNGTGVVVDMSTLPLTGGLSALSVTAESYLAGAVTAPTSVTTLVLNGGVAPYPTVGTIRLQNNGDNLPNYKGAIVGRNADDSGNIPIAFVDNMNRIDIAGGVLVIDDSSGAAVFDGSVTTPVALILADGAALRSDTTTAHTALLQAYDVNATAYVSFVTMTNANAPTFVLAPSGDGTVALTGNTSSAGAFVGVLTSPAVANIGANSCGTTAASIAGTDNVWTVTVGATAGTACRITFDTTAPTVWKCQVTNNTTLTLAATPHQTGGSTTTADISGVFTAGDAIDGICIAR